MSFDRVNTIFTLTVGIKLEEFEQYNQFVEQKFIERVRDFESRMDELEPDEVDEYIDFYGDEINAFVDTFPTRIRYSMIVMIHSFFETELDRIVQRFQNDIQSPIKRSDFKGSKMEQCKAYLQKVVLFEIDQKAWEEIDRFITLRNMIVHHEGIIPEAKGKAKEKISKLKRASIKEDNEITLEQEIISGYLELIKQVLYPLFNHRESLRKKQSYN